uniref:tRNA(Phe) 7-[(3-amino-3-carboxypropyl)-4-demethylwyosine(37)-N(4)]-methyltransferase n=1 Tax=Arundo donax TaxID=35708 RepID=A0A0A9E695_ARUDO
MDFAHRKAAALAALSSPAPDKSPKGGVDAPIAPLLDVLNSHPDLFTTSSCSGRVSVLAQPQEGQGPKPKKKARGGGWVPGVRYYKLAETCNGGNKMLNSHGTASGADW